MSDDFSTLAAKFAAAVEYLRDCKCTLASAQSNYDSAYLAASNLEALLREALEDLRA